MARSMFTICVCAIAAIISGHDASAFAPSAINVKSATSISSGSARQFSPFTANNAFMESGVNKKQSTALNMSEKKRSPRLSRSRNKRRSNRPIPNPIRHPHRDISSSHRSIRRG
mmetsp:Transcript_18611/g.29191  ORF Transcript_18611/g.29191 Transcript_18611/m.29191 type:complete len:114 (+) Transcript_18611:69-410(+)